MGSSDDPFGADDGSTADVSTSLKAQLMRVFTDVNGDSSDDPRIKQRRVAEHGGACNIKTKQ